jgi:hypothetical protein
MPGDTAGAHVYTTCLWANLPYGPIFGKQVLPDMLVPAVATLQCEHGLGKRTACLGLHACCPV